MKGRPTPKSPRAESQSHREEQQHVQGRDKINHEGNEGNDEEKGFQHPLDFLQATLRVAARIEPAN